MRETSGNLILNNAKGYQMTADIEPTLPALEVGASKFSPPVPYRMNQVWQNWGRTAHCQPEFSFYPKCVEDLIQIVEFACERGKRIRVVGSGHSWSGLVPTDGILVYVYQLNRVTMDLSDDSHPRVVIESGATVKEVNDILEEHGYALPLNVVLESVRFGGLIATGSHGSGWNNPTLSDLVHAIELVDAAGNLRKFEADVDSDEVMNAVRLNLGMFGIMYRITMNVQKSWIVHAHDQRLPIQHVFEDFRHLVRTQDNFDLFWWPFSDEFWVKTWKSIPHTSITAKPRHSRSDKLISDIGSRFHNGLIRLSETHPRLTPPISRFTFKLTPSKGNKVVDIVEAIHYRRAIEYTKMGCVEVAFKIDPHFENVKWAIKEVFKRVKTYARRGEYPMNVVMNVRFINNSNCLLSPAFGGEHTCYIEILSRAKPADWKRFSGQVAQDWLTLPEAMPHWAKEFQHIPNVIQHIKSYLGENIPRFNQIKDQLQVDPTNMFVNPLLEEIFLK
ncbi:MAG TPA: D-arabinono-1,4-lactone oxidase [Anaerolineales bacterium]|nr:D-arabinono-1,4-lactone oxidase [Anaerolineales bacterium]